MKNRPLCPHCQVMLSRWSVPDFQFSDGLGWGCLWLYVCFNDKCKMFVSSFDYMKKSFGQKLGYRYMLHPDSGECSSIPVGGVNAMKGDVIDEEEEELAEQYKQEREWRRKGGE